MIQTKDIVVVKGDKDSSTVTTKSMTNDGIMKGTYIENIDNMLQELSQSQDFLYRNFYNYECYKDMKLDRNQLA